MIIKIVKLSFLSLLLIGIVFSALALPLFASAIITVKPGEVAGVNANDTGKLPPIPISKVSQLVDIVRAVLVWVYYIFFIISVIYVVLAAYAYLGEGEDAEKLKGIHKQLMWAAIAIAVALISVGINAIIENFIRPGV